LPAGWRIAPTDRWRNEVIEEKWFPKKESPAVGSDRSADRWQTKVIEEKWFPQE